MQDWNYVNTNCFEVTIELGCVKYPLAKELPKYWEQNWRALLQFMHQVQKSGVNVSMYFTFTVFYLLLFVLLFVTVGSHGNKRHRF